MNSPLPRAALYCAVAAAAIGIAMPVPCAQTPPDTPATYGIVAVKPAEAHSDESFAVFRKDLSEVARGRIFAELERIVLTPGFFWERDFAGAFDPKRSPAENLAAAIGLERNNGAGWQWLAEVAAETSAEKMPSRPGVICAPGRATFDEFEFARLVESTHSARSDWGYARAGRTEVRAEPRERSAIVARIELHFIRIGNPKGAENTADALRTSWTRVVLPSGKSGYVAPGKLAPASPSKLCYEKDAFGRWRIAGFVAAAD